MVCIEKVVEIVEIVRYDVKLIDELCVFSYKLVVVVSVGVVFSFEQVLESLQFGFVDGMFLDGDGEGVMNVVVDFMIVMWLDVLYVVVFFLQNIECVVCLNFR